MMPIDSMLVIISVLQRLILYLQLECRKNAVVVLAFFTRIVIICSLTVIIKQHFGHRDM